MQDARRDDGTLYLSSADFGRIAGVTPGAVRALVTRGRLKPATVTAGGIQLFTVEQAERYAVERQRRTRRRPS